MISRAGEKRLRSLVLFMVGVAMVIKFAFWSPGQLNSFVVFVMAMCLFGASAITYFTGGRPRDDE